MDDVIMRFNEQFIDDVIFLDFLAKRPRDSSGDADVAPENPASACKMHCLHMCICMNVLIICYFMLFFIFHFLNLFSQRLIHHI